MLHLRWRHSAANPAPTLEFPCHYLDRLQQFVHGSEQMFVAGRGKSIEARRRQTVCQGGFQAGDDQGGVQEGDQEKPSSLDAGGGGSDDAAVGRPEKPGGEPGPGAMFLLWRDFTGLFDSVLPGFKTTVFLWRITFPFHFLVCLFLFSWKLFNYKGTLVTSDELNIKLLPLVISDQLDKKFLELDKKLLCMKVMILGDAGKCERGGAARQERRMVVGAVKILTSVSPPASPATPSPGLPGVSPSL